MSALGGPPAPTDTPFSMSLGCLVRRGPVLTRQHSVTLVVLVGLAIVSVPVWIFVNNFGTRPKQTVYRPTQLISYSHTSAVKRLGPDSFPQGHPHRV